MRPRQSKIRIINCFLLKNESNDAFISFTRWQEGSLLHAVKKRLLKEALCMRRVD